LCCLLLQLLQLSKTGIEQSIIERFVKVIFFLFDNDIQNGLTIFCSDDVQSYQTLHKLKMTKHVKHILRKCSFQAGHFHSGSVFTPRFDQPIIVVQNIIRECLQGACIMTVSPEIYSWSKCDQGYLFVWLLNL